MAKANRTDSQNFDRMMGKLSKVPHSALKAKLDTEKTAKKRKPKRSSASCALGAKI